jgi:hypothetical protein
LVASIVKSPDEIVERLAAAGFAPYGKKTAEEAL